MQEKEKETVTARPIMSKSRVSSYYSPSFLKVATLIEADDQIFVPSYDRGEFNGATLLANLPNGPLTLSSGGTDVVDCGFSIDLSAGYGFVVESLLGGVFVAPCIIENKTKQRVRISVTNARNEVVSIKHKQKFASLSLRPVHLFEWIIT
jgi:dUTPase